MSINVNAPSAQGKRKAPRLGTFSLLAAFVLAIILTAPGNDASTALHSAARVVRPAHRAATLLPVVNQDDIKVHHRELADKVLRSLPFYCRDNLKTFYVRYDKPANRGLGGETTIIVTGSVPDNEFMALVVHECGHVTDLGGLRGSEASGLTKFFDGDTAIYADDPSIAFYSLSWSTASTRKKGSKDADFVSGYAKSDPFEDFAESFVYYALQEKEFFRLAQTGGVMKAKFEFMQWLFGDNASFADGLHMRGKSIPWDVTKMPYVWIAKK